MRNYIIEVEGEIIAKDVQQYAVNWVCGSIGGDPETIVDDYVYDERRHAVKGNFGKYDERIKRETPSIPRPLWLPCIGEKRARGKKVPRQLWHAWEKLKHNMRLVGHYPEEVMWEPGFRVYHWIWRRLELWRYE